jgi:hypothetical protein
MAEMSSESPRPVERTWRSLTEETPLEPLDPQSRLSPSPHARFVRENGRLTRLDLGGRVVRLDEADGERIDAFVGRLDGKRTLIAVAEALGWPVDETLDTAQELYLFAAVHHVGDAPVPALTFSHHLDQYVKAVQVRMRESVPSLLDALERAPSRRLLLGGLVETYHLVNAAASHISPAIARSPNTNLQMMFSEYLAGEYWHGLWLRQGLRAADISETDLDRCDPLPGTMAAINCLRWAASNDLLAYSACLAAGELEGGARSAERVEHYFDALVKLNLVSEEVIRPFKLHTLEDCGADHHSYASEAFAISPPLTRAQQDQIRRTVLMLQRSVGEQQLQIVRYYGGDGPPFFTVD